MQTSANIYIPHRHWSSPKKMNFIETLHCNTGMESYLCPNELEKVSKVFYGILPNCSKQECSNGS